MMEAVIKIVTARKKFNRDQVDMMRRVCLVLREHKLSAVVVLKVRKTKIKVLKLSG